jgi:DNA-binding MarR family transcriptional regulator
MDDATNIRKIARLTAEYMISMVGLLTQASGMDPTDILILNAVSAANVAHIIDDPEKVDVYWSKGQIIPFEVRRPITSLAISESLGLPRETCRRRIKGLVEKGLLERQPGGLMAIQERADPVQMAAMFAANAQLFRKLVRKLRKHGVEV